MAIKQTNFKTGYTFTYNTETTRFSIVEWVSNPNDRNEPVEIPTQVTIPFEKARSFVRFYLRFNKPRREKPVKKQKVSRS